MTKGEINKKKKNQNKQKKKSYFQSVMAVKRIFRNTNVLTILRKSVSLTKLRWEECFFFLIYLLLN